MRRRASHIAVMFDEEDDKVKTYRGRADHARIGATETNSPDLKEILLRLAASYDARANEAERKEQERTAAVARYRDVTPP